MDRMSRYLRELSERESIWFGGVCANYALAYNTAYRSFTGQLRAEEEYRKRQAELFLLAASVATSTFMVAAFASASLRTLAARGAIATICNNSLNRTFNAVYAVSNSQPAMFAIGKALDIAKSTASTKIKKTTERILLNFSANSSDDPLAYKIKLDQFIYLSSYCVRDIVGWLQDDPKISPAESDAIMDSLEKAPIFNPPCATIDHESLAKRIELTLFMNRILDSDYVEDVPFKPHNFGVAGAVGVFQKRKLTPIQHLPSDKDYPSPTKAKIDNMGVLAHKKISYENQGENIENYIDNLHNDVMGRPFFKELPNLTKMHSALVMAERTLSEISNKCRPININMVMV